MESLFKFLDWLASNQKRALIVLILFAVAFLCTVFLPSACTVIRPGSVELKGEVNGLHIDSAKLEYNRLFEKFYEK